MEFFAPSAAPTILENRSVKEACLVDRKSCMNSRLVQKIVATRTKRPKPYGLDERSFTIAIILPKIKKVMKCPATFSKPLSKEFSIAPFTRSLNSMAEKEKSNGVKLYAIIRAMIIRKYNRSGTACGPCE
jgi:hypothetical protein